MARINHDRNVNEEIRTAGRRENVVAGEPGYGLGLAGFIVSFFVSLVGLIMSAIALKQSRAAGKKNAFALAGLIIGIVFTVFGIVAAVASIGFGIFVYNYCHDNPNECRDNYRGGSYDARYYDDMAPSDRTY